jgi:hypothetical protein
MQKDDVDNLLFTVQILSTDLNLSHQLTQVDPENAQGEATELLKEGIIPSPKVTFAISRSAAAL